MNRALKFFIKPFSAANGFARVTMWLTAVAWILISPSVHAKPVEDAQSLEALWELDPAKDLQQIADTAEQLAQAAGESAKERKTNRRAREADLANASMAELKSILRDSADHLSPRELRGVQHAARLARLALQNRGSERDPIINDLAEVLMGLRNNRRSPIPATTGALSLWKLGFEHSHRSIGKGNRPATNLVLTNDDRSLCDPQPSGFWHRPANIAKQNLARGFSRTHLPNFSETLWTYDKPKTSAGTRPGFEVEGNGKHYKIKLAEFSSEPFTARIFHALGYYVDPTDYAAELKIRYSRRLFREFNLRRPLTMRMRPFWIPMGSVELQPYYDPFKFIRFAVFNDGRKITGDDLKAQLLIHPELSRAEELAENYRPEVEAQLDYLVLGPANVQPEDVPSKPVGAWDFGSLGHQDRRELRGAGLLAAWLGWFDSRFDNTRLRIAPGEDRQLQFFFTDLGSGMGSGGGWLIRHGENPDAMEWTFTSPKIVRGPGRMTTPFRVRNFRTIVPTPAFQEMTVDDARWMARLIAQLTPAQLADALRASGYLEADAELYLAKLWSRRNQMLQDLEITP